MPLRVGIRVTPRVACRRNALCIRFPGLAGSDQIANDIVHANRTRKRIIVSNELPSRKHEVVSDGGMGIGEVLGGQAILRGQTVQIWHGRIPDHFGIAVIFLEYHNHMAKLRERAG